jgi:adenylate cyclase
VRRLVSVGLLTLVVTGLAWLGLDNGVFFGFQQRATDALLPSAANDPHVVVVGIDAKTIDAYGTPLPRDAIAQLTRALATDGAAVIAYDVVFRTESPDQVQPDAEFAAAIDAADNVVLGRQIVIEGHGGLLEATNVSDISPGLQSANFASGHVQVTADPNDGVTRTLPLVVAAKNGTFLPSLSLAALMVYRGVNGPPIVRPGGVQVGNRFIPTGANQSLVLNFSSNLSDTAHVLSIKDVIDGTVPKSKIAGKIVFVGAISPTLGDNRLAPVNKSTGLPGVMLHANAVNTMLTADYLDPVSTGQTLFWVALLTLLVGLAVLMLPLWLSPIVTVMLAAAYFVLAAIRFDQGHVFNLVYGLLAVVFAFVGALGLRYFGETRQRRRVTALFSQYVPETVAQRLVDEDRATLAAEGERLDMTVLFCDLRGFTALSESLSPAVVRVMLNHYYDRVTDIVLEMRGTLMKYVGDEVFAVWGAPLPSADHPARALECAIAIQDLTPTLNQELLERGAPEVSFGIGLHTGDAVAAHFGGGRRRQYDVVGDTVNVGARLCSAAGRGEIIVSDELLSRVPSPPPVEPVGPIELKGVSRALRLWRVIRGEGTAVQPAPAVIGAHRAAEDAAHDGAGAAVGGNPAESSS